MINDLYYTIKYCWNNQVLILVSGLDVIVSSTNDFKFIT